MQRNLICVKWGPAYGPEYAINLYNGVKRYQDKNFAMHIFTDDASHLPTGKDWFIHHGIFLQAGLGGIRWKYSIAGMA